MTRTVLVAYGSKKGSTAEIAQFIASILRDGGEADARRAAEVRDMRSYQAVVLGGALRMGGTGMHGTRYQRGAEQGLSGRRKGRPALPRRRSRD
ncbi:hypothetical protein OG905_05485 [Streptomyces sp. NBC_00322]|uniref:flavodoxin domain-containing protein n=1 Tax=Streptomyces sp. NBC_00322 TaxID=2975712 RepID=UPI002E29A5A6|nr:flavodoxin domain-containing protein [Streptomyces sp. NBC_00322]